MENSDQAGFPDTEMAVKADLAMRLAGQQWDAEQENSRRLANRANGLLATVALLSGLGIFKVPELGKIDPLWLNWTVRCLIAVIALWLIFGLIHILDLRPPARSSEEKWWHLPRKFYRWLRRISRPMYDGPEITKSKAPFASSLLQEQWVLESSAPAENLDLLQLKPDTIREIHYYRLAQAAFELHGRNVERQLAIVRGQAWFMHAAVLAFFVAIILVFCA